MHQAKELKIKYAQNIGTVIFSALLLFGMVTCFIIDIAITGTLTWSLIPISACIFAGIVFAPAIKYGVKGIKVSLIIYSVFVVPFLFILSLFVDSGGLLIPIGIRMSVISLVYLWGTFALFKVLRARKFAATAITLLLAIPLSIVANFTLSRIIDVSLFSTWDALTFVIIAVVAAIFLFLDFTIRKSHRHNKADTHFRA